MDNFRQLQPVNMAFVDTPAISAADGDILISFKPERHKSTPEYVEMLRAELPKRFPDITFFFQPADIVNQILNFGLPSPADVQIAAYNPNLHCIAREIEQKLKVIPGPAELHL